MMKPISRLMGVVLGALHLGACRSGPQAGTKTSHAQPSPWAGTW